MFSLSPGKHFQKVNESFKKFVIGDFAEPISYCYAKSKNKLHSKILRFSRFMGCQNVMVYTVLFPVFEVFSKLSWRRNMTFL